MSALKRIERYIKATIHEGLDRIENPEMMVKQHIRDVKESIKKAERTIQKQRQIQDMLKRDKDMTERLMVKREEQAVDALKSGEDQLAKKLLLDKKHLANQVVRYGELTHKSMEVKHYYEVEIEKLQDQYNQLREKKVELALRMQSAKTHKHVKPAQKQSLIDLDDEFERYDEQLMIREDSVITSSRSDLFEANNEIEVEDEVRRLKEKLNEQASH